MTFVTRRADSGPARSRHTWLKEGSFIWDPLPLEVLADRALSHWAKLIFPIMSNLTVQTGYSYKSHPALALLIGCSTDTVEDALGCLVARGLLTKEGVSGGSNRYRVVSLHLVYDDVYRTAVSVLSRRAWTPEQRQDQFIAQLQLERTAKQHRESCPVCKRRIAAKPRREASR
jgi:hypothetical protein